MFHVFIEWKKCYLNTALFFFHFQVSFMINWLMEISFFSFSLWYFLRSISVQKVTSCKFRGSATNLSHFCWKLFQERSSGSRKRRPFKNIPFDLDRWYFAGGVDPQSPPRTVSTGYYWDLITRQSIFLRTVTRPEFFHVQTIVEHFSTGFSGVVSTSKWLQQQRCEFRLSSLFHLLSSSLSHLCLLNTKTKLTYLIWKRKRWNDVDFQWTSVSRARDTNVAWKPSKTELKTFYGSHIKLTKCLVKH